MPIGNCAAIPWVARHLVNNRPQRVLDLGIGFGMYGAVVRQWLDLGVQPWKTELTGVEAWASYRNPAWDLYDLVFVETIQQFLARNPEPYDCLILGDVIEHLEKQDGLELLDNLREIVAPGGHLIVVTPAVFVHQDAVHGNEWERHRSFWTPADFHQSGFDVPLSADDPQVGFDPTLIATWHRA